MKEPEVLTPLSPIIAEHEIQDTGYVTTREAETGDAAEANAPTSIRANAGMNTILGVGFGTGIQTDASDE